MYRFSFRKPLMKKIIGLLLFLALGSLASVQDAPAAKNHPSKCAASKCDAGVCSADCCGSTVKLAVDGLEKEGIAETTEITLSAMAGINHCSTFVKSGTVMVKYDTDKMSVADIEKAVAQNGIKIVGYKANFKVKGLACQSCSNHLITILGKTKGVVNVDKICHMSGTVGITFDAKTTDKRKLKAAIHTTKYKVVESKKEAPAAATPQS